MTLRNQKEIASEVMRYLDRDEGIGGFPLYRTRKKDKIPK